MRFFRDFELVITPPQGAPVVVKPPQRIVFNVDKSISGGLNRATLQVYNLREDNRLAIVKDAEQAVRIPIVLRVGYEGNVETVFQGTIHTSSNDRRGPDFISTINALDGGEDYLRGFVAETVTTKQQAVDAVLRGMPNTRPGKLTELKEITRPKIIIGNPYKAIPALLQPGETFYIDNEQLFILKDDEVVQTYIPRVEARTGLLKTPQREYQKITFETLMNPALKIGARCDLQSVNAPHLNGVMRIESISYSGDSDGQDWKQTITGFQSSNFKVL